MKWTRNRRRGFKRRAGFTLVELLAAMVFMAIVIPVAVEGLRIAARAGEVGQRKAVAARVMDSKLNEYLANVNSRSTIQKGVVKEGAIDFNWSIQVENWREDSMRLVTCEVTYPAQGQEFSVQGSTLIGLTTQ